MEENSTPSESHNTRNVIIGVVVLAVIIAALSFMPKKDKTPNTGTNNAVVTNYETCVSAGFPIAQTSPMTCSTPDGRTFTNSVVVTEAEAVIDVPQIAQVVTSPMVIKGKARGTWFFEANLPIILKDENGKVIAQKGYMTSDNWMTTDFVNIDTTLSFKAPTTDYGILEIHNDNPSGDPAKDKFVSVPVRFK